jgi:CubicO group peptidase (beta-lactamase class C family)
MKHLKASLSLAVALLLGTLPVTAQELPRATPAQVGISQERLDRVIQVLRDDTGRGLVPGAVILVARHGKIAAFEFSGLLDPATKRPMTREAIFRIYSMSKPITTVCAMMLVEEGKLALEDSVAKYIPSFAHLQVGVERPIPRAASRRSNWWRRCGRSTFET